MKLTVLILILSVSSQLFASSAAIPLDEAPIDIQDEKSIANGAKLYVEYCSGCHSLKHLRYSRLEDDLGIDQTWLKQNIVPSTRKIHDSMVTAMDMEEARVWFGMIPPDLSIIARAKGADWLYTYLRAFYRDDSKPYGTNNLISPGVAMPHVFAKLGGVRDLNENITSADSILNRLPIISAGSMSDTEFNKTTADLVAFLTYAAEPSQYDRKSIGKYVLLYLLFFTVVAYYLKKEYWRDIKK